MVILKQIASYFIWVVLALVSGMGYMWVLLTPFREFTSGFAHIFSIIHDLAVFHIGLIVGGVIAVLFVLVDIFYLRKKPAGIINSTAGRFVLLLAVAIVVAITHYFLEKVIDII